MNKQVIVMRGLPGSGKSYHAKTYYEGAVVLSADHFFINAEGEYVYEPAKIGAAHAFCFREYIKVLQANTADTIIVDNTNCTAVEISPYMLAAAAFKRDAKVVTVHCPVELCASRNTHGVPLAVIEKMQVNLSVALPPWWLHEERTWNHEPIPAAVPHL
jgi:predicted kinase